MGTFSCSTHTFFNIIFFSVKRFRHIFIIGDYTSLCIRLEKDAAAAGKGHSGENNRKTCFIIPTGRPKMKLSIYAFK